jgi:hypothetical protein
MITQRIDELTYAVIERLVEQKVPESRVLDYKRQLPGGTADEVKELLADVTSFANASGGHLVFGVTTVKENGKNTAIPEAIVGVGEINAEEVENRIDAQLRSCIQPRIAGLRVKVIAEAGKLTVVVIHIPRSWNAPHMVAKGSSKFYSRTSAGKQPLDVTEIRHAFAMSESVGERIRAFRDERIGRILAGETPVPIKPGATVVVHCIPLEAFADNEMIDLVSLETASKDISLFGSRWWSDKRINFDGLFGYSQPADSAASAYLQVFRNGVTEIVDGVLIQPPRSPNEVKVIDIPSLEINLMMHGDEVRKVFERLGIGSPALIFVSLLNVRGFVQPPVNNFDRRPCGIDREHLLLPDVFMDNPGIAAETFLRSAFDRIWQACGVKKSPYYDAKGNRIL